MTNSDKIWLLFRPVLPVGDKKGLKTKTTLDKSNIRPSKYESKYG